MEMLSILLSIAAIVITIYMARKTIKIQFLLTCFLECMEIGRLKNGNLAEYEQRRDALLDKVNALGKEFSKIVEEYKQKQNGPDCLNTDSILKKLDNQLTEEIKKYSKYIKV